MVSLDIGFRHAWMINITRLVMGLLRGTMSEITRATLQAVGGDASKYSDSFRKGRYFSAYQRCIGDYLVLGGGREHVNLDGPGPVGLDLFSVASSRQGHRTVTLMKPVFSCSGPSQGRSARQLVLLCLSFLPSSSGVWRWPHITFALSLSSGCHH